MYLDLFLLFKESYSSSIKTAWVFFKKGVLRNFAKLTGKRLCQSIFFNKVAVIRPVTLLKKKRLWHWCFPVNFTKFLRTLFLQNTFGRLLLFLYEVNLGQYRQIRWLLVVLNERLINLQEGTRMQISKSPSIFVFIWK